MSTTHTVPHTLVEAQAVIGLLMDQIHQMKGMFGDEDGAIQAALDHGIAFLRTAEQIAKEEVRYRILAINGDGRPELLSAEYRTFEDIDLAARKCRDSRGTQVYVVSVMRGTVSAIGALLGPDPAWIISGAAK